MPLDPGELAIGRLRILGVMRCSPDASAWRRLTVRNGRSADSMAHRADSDDARNVRQIALELAPAGQEGQRSTIFTKLTTLTRRFWAPFGYNAWRLRAMVDTGIS